MTNFRREKRTLGEGRFLRLVASDNWEYVERIGCRTAVVIVAVTDAGELLLVEQYRAPVAARVIELPAGLVGDAAAPETEVDAAQRELLEETGYLARAFEQLCTGPPSAGMSSEMISFYRASQLTRQHAGGGVDDEAISVHHVPLAAIEAWLAERSESGCVIDPRVYVGLYFCARSLAEHHC